MNPEIIDTARRLQKAGDIIAQKASELKKVADQLRADVDALAERVTNLENVVEE